MRRACLLLLPLLLFACSPVRRAGRFYAKTLKKEIETSAVFANSFSGFALLDPETGKILCDVNGSHLFTPASNTKILTLYTCLKVLGDSLPAFRWHLQNDTFFFRGTGDPTFLHPEFQAWPSSWLSLRAHAGKPMCFLTRMDDHPERLGRGWAWDDYQEKYSAERSAMPSYGNAAILQKEKGRSVGVLSPPGFSIPVVEMPEAGLMKLQLTRAEGLNRFYVRYDTAFTDSIDFKAIVPLHIGESRNPLFGRNGNVRFTVRFVPAYPPFPWHTCYGTPVDTVYRRMMHQSDNFLAEQLLLACAGVKLDTLREDRIIRWALDSLLPDLPQKPRWVDGSGLSRYNLNTPRNNAWLLQRLWSEFPHERVLSFFPAGGQTGTVSDFYKGPEDKPYVFAKSGSMSGVQCLSGYLITTRGRVLIFSFMHNNFTGPGRPWKEEMQRLLELVRREGRAEN